MVSFICNACGQTVRKNQVEKHYSTSCRQCEVLSCIDCGKDFHGDDYANHTSCISEAEKYQGKLFQPKDKANKGEQKQQEWIKQLQEVSASVEVDPSIKKHLKTLKQYSNIPRKKAKFQNFCKNSVNIHDQAMLDKLWDAFSGGNKGSETSSEPVKNGKEPTEDNDVKQEKSDEEPTDEETKKTKEKKEKRKKKGKRKLDEEEMAESKTEDEIQMEENNKKEKKSKKKRKREWDENQNEESKVKIPKVEENGSSELNSLETELVQGKFNWGSIIKQVLKKVPNNELPVKKLRKKVMAEFLSRGDDGRSHTDVELKALFMKKLNKNPNIKVKKEVAKLCI